MGPKTRSGAGVSADAVSAALDRLYGARLDEFIALRRDLAAALRKGGNAPASRLVAAASKPSRTAWALNQVARRRPEILVAVLDARTKAVAAQKDGTSEAVRATARAYRDEVARAVRAAAEILQQAGVDLPAIQARRLGSTVQALAGEEADGRAKLLGGRLVADIEVDDPFAGLEVGLDRERRTVEAPVRDDVAERRVARAARATQAAAEAARERAGERERERKAQELEKARDRLRALEQEASEARATARQAEVAATRAQADADRARRAVEAVERQLDEARRIVRTMA
jgi:hypothetical protein